MTRAPKRVYWDSCAWIAYIRKEMPGGENFFTEPRYEMCRAVLKRAEAGDLEIATSAFTLAEVSKRRKEMTGPAINLAAFFDQRFILLIPVDKQVGLMAQNLQLTGVGSLKPQDAIHAASALVWSIPILQTFDGPLSKLDNVLTCADGQQLRVMMPSDDEPTPELLKAMQGR